METPEAAVCSEPAAGQGRRASKVRFLILGAWGWLLLGPGLICPCQACETCRAKKIKCDESRPTCRYCRKRKLPCQYRKEKQAV